MATGARPWLIASAAVLAGTALFHFTGLPMAAAWLEGPRGQLVQLLWLSPGFDWLVVAAIWLFAALRPSRALAPFVVLACLIPAFTAIGLAVLTGATHPGLYLLAGAIGLALAGARKLR
jgi:hypothetical protein